MVSAAPRQELLQRLRHHGGDRPPRDPGMLADSCRQPGRHLDREHHGRLRNRHPARCRRLIHIPAGLPQRAAEPAGQHPRRLSRRHAPLGQLRGCVDPLSTLAAASTAMHNHAINVLPDMSLAGHDTPRPLQPPVAQRDVEAEAIHCVGGVLSPLLANIALSALDDHFDQIWHQEMGTAWQRKKRRRHGQGNYQLLRYADDFVLMVSGDRHHAEALREEVTAVLAPMGLRLASEKTRVVHIDEGFNFLGFHIRRMRKRGTQKNYVYTRPSRKAVQAIKDKVTAKTYRSTRHQGLAELITSLNRSLAGWANYFRHGSSKTIFGAVDRHAWGRLMRWIRAKYAGKHRLGMRALRRRFCDQGWRFACNGVVFTGASSVAVTRYRYRGHTIATPWTPKPATAINSG
jgi:hypothetical protein